MAKKNFHLDEKALTRFIRDEATEKLKEMSIDSHCPECSQEMIVNYGINQCQNCGHEFDLDYRFTYED